MRTIAIVNQKGGCGKTTTAINLSACLAQKNKKVLLVDLDPQSNASIGLKVTVEDLDRSIYDIFSQSHALEDVIIPIDQYLHSGTISIDPQCCRAGTSGESRS